MMWPVKVHEYSRNTEEEMFPEFAMILRQKHRGENCGSIENEILVRKIPRLWIKVSPVSLESRNKEED